MGLVGGVVGSAALCPRIGRRGDRTDVDIDGDVVAEVVLVRLEMGRQRRGRRGGGATRFETSSGQGGSGELNVMVVDGGERWGETWLVVGSGGVVGSGAQLLLSHRQGG